MGNTKKYLVTAAVHSTRPGRCANLGSSSDRVGILASVEGGPSIGALSGPAIAAVGSVVRSRDGCSPARRQVLRDVAVLKDLPEGSDARRVMQSHLDEFIGRMLRKESEKRADPFGIGPAVLFILTGAVMVVVGLTAKTWSWVWYASAAFILPLGCAGLASSVEHKARDDRGELPSCPVSPELSPVLRVAPTRQCSNVVR